MKRPKPGQGTSAEAFIKAQRRALTGRGVLAAAALLALPACQGGAPAQAESSLAEAPSAHAPAGPASAAAPQAGASQPEAAASRPAPAQQPVVTVSHGYTVRWLRPLQERGANDGVQVIDDERQGGVRLVVTSSTGAGAAEVRPAQTAWPNAVQVQFQYPSGRPFDELDALDLRVTDTASLAGDQEPDLVPDGFVVWRRDGALRVALPGGWLHARQGLRIAWIDHLGVSTRPSR